MPTREENRDLRRRRALAAARELVAEGGVEALSLRALATASGQAVNTLYALFGTREGILEAIITEGIARMAQTAAATTTRPSIEAVDALLTAIVRQAVAQRAFIQPMYRVMTVQSVKDHAGRRAGVGLFQRLFDGLISAGVLERGADSHLLAEHVVDGFVVASLLWSNDAIDQAEYLRRARYCLLLALGAAATPGCAEGLRRHRRALERQAKRGARR